MSKIDEALEHYREGFSCSQSVFLVFREPDGLSERDALKLSTVFGAGNCGLGSGLCGAATGALMALSMKHGMGDLESPEAKTRTYALGRQYLGEFTRRMEGLSTCEAILGVSPLSPEYQEKAKELRATKCTHAVRTAAEVLDSLLAAK